MEPSSLFDDGDGPANLAGCLEIAQQDYSVSKVGDVDGRFHVSHEAVLRNGEKGRGTLPIEILQQFVNMKDEGVFLGHGRLVAVKTINDDRLGIRRLD